MPRRLKKPSPERLRRRALAYLQRFSTSRAHLRFVLLRRAGPEAEQWQIGRDALEHRVDALLDDLGELGLIDDRRYAAGHARSLVERGKPLSRVRAALAAKGVDGSLVDEALGEIAPDIAESDLASALRYARKRRIGPYRITDDTDGFRQKELAKLARAGFDYATAKRVVDMEDSDLTP